MGTFSTSLSADDLYADIYYEFFELYNEGYLVADITEKLLAENREIYEDLTDPNGSHNFWFAIAKAQWECKELDPAILKRITSIIQKGENLQAWRDLEAPASVLKKRRVVLDKLLQTLNSERIKPKTRRKKSTKVYDPVYEAGDYIAVRLDNGYYGGAVVLEAQSGTIDQGAYNLIALTDIYLSHKPDLSDFKKAYVLYCEYHAIDIETRDPITEHSIELRWIYCRRPDDIDTNTEVICNKTLRNDYYKSFKHNTSWVGKPFNNSTVMWLEKRLTSEKPEIQKAKRVRLNKLTGLSIFSR